MNMNPFVEPAWLAARLQDPNTVILDATLPPVGVNPPVDTSVRYHAQHIPGAIFFDINEHSDHNTTLPHMLPTAEAFSQSMSSLGITDTATIVIYEQQSVFSAPRAWWMFHTFGVENVHILNGGLTAWLAANLPTESGEVHRASATFHTKLNQNAVKDFSQIQQLLGQRAQILDARSSGRFTGAVPEPRAGISSGHMPGATSTPYTDLIEDGRLKSPEKLRHLFAEKKVDLNRPITTTCGSGVTAAVVSLALKLAGAKDVTLYDGSWSDYAQRPEAVIEKSS
ncbi:MAG TPA: 3-mercaptopyruvate sulfurtransferase [Edaphobacter sp.]|jgi:thiosulfate/3-mercaptopyruvate sulfurtransferase|nr:3-mercaptopyruvate sulfurtransferase [Edaphobacter sp.]